MKKWFVGLMMLLALVLMQSTAMAATKCPTCNDYRTVKYIDDYEYLTAKMHKQIGVCSTCNTKLGGKFLYHTESLAATCTSPAYCNQCQHYYGLKNKDNHNWSEWQPNQYFPNQHYRYCLNGCGASENEPHDGNSNCVTSATCSICNATYKDTTVHAGPLTYTYEKEDESFHKKIESCTACGKRTGSFVSTKHVEKSPANCTYAAFCAVCESHYGGINPDNHDWNKWVCKDENQHYRICINNNEHIQFADHRGHATCIVTMPCLDCGQLYNEPDKHQGPYTYAYAPSASSANKHTVTETCTGCGETSRTYEEAHDLELHAAQAPTCKAEGWKSYETCKHCTYSTYSAIKPDPNAHVGTPTTTYAKTSEDEHTPMTTYSICKHRVTGTPEEHTQSTAATCTTAAYCGICQSNYGDIDLDAHDLVQHAAQASTCGGMGWNAYEACTRCDYTTLTQLPKLVHWYGEWTPNADGTHSATCRRGCGDRRTVACAVCTCQLPTGGAITLCPVCGEVSDGTRLTLAENASAVALTGALPGGELVVRMGTLENGETIVSIAFELGGKLTQPSGQVKITLPGVLDGYALHLLHEDGTETLLTDVQDGSFMLDFSGYSSPVRVIRLVAVV